ncbi:MAG: redoxin domain-containing protein [Kiritimatiellae bacterium]|nr:redoxin domain-containing protein [Kiritimatiellia bacterium]
MKKLIVAALSASFAANLMAAGWRNLDDASWYSGDKLTEADLAGKVVLVDQWGIHCPPCQKLLPRMEKIWNSFKSKKFILLGSHHQPGSAEEVRAVISKKKLTYPIYNQADLIGAPSSNGLPFMYVVNHNGQVVYSGRDDKAAIEAVVNALGEIGKPPSIIPGVEFGAKSPYRSLEKQLVLGKPTANIEKKLKGDIEKAEKKSATAKQKEAAVEARNVLAALERSKKDVKAVIEAAKTANPEEALKLAQLYMKSFPEEGAEYKDQIADMKKKIAEWKAEQKERAAEAKKAAKK